MSTPEKLSADEIALYDRQIRLWGTDTQLRLRSARILMINLGAVGTETVKNLVLGGINSIEILDNSTVKEEDFAAQFFLPNDESIVGQKKLPLVMASIKELNTRVHLSANTSDIEDIKGEYFQRFDLVIATELSKSELLHVNDITRDLKIPLYVAGLHGSFGYILTDLIEHVSVKDLDKGNQSRVVNSQINSVKTITGVEPLENEGKERVTIMDQYVPLREIFSSTKLTSQLNKRQLKRLSAALPLILALFEVPRPENPEACVDRHQLCLVSKEVCKRLSIPETTITDEYLQDLSNQAYTEFAPSAAIIGGVLAQDIIQFFGKKDSPLNNVLIFDAPRAEMPIFFL